jgi:hypothetical protein
VVSQTSYSGILLSNVQNLSQKIVVKGILKPIKYAAQDKKNEIWAADIIGDYIE